MKKTAKEIADDVVGNEKKRSWLSRYAPLMAGVGLGGLGYGLSRTRFLSKLPVLRELQQQTGKDYIHTPTDELTSEQFAAMPIWRKALRRMSQGPELIADYDSRGRIKVPKELLERIRKGDASLFDYRTQAAIGRDYIPGWTNKARKTKWGISDAPSKRKIPDLEDKLEEMRVLKKHAPEAAIRSESLQDIMRKHKIVLNSPEEYKRLQTILRKAYPEGFVLKPRAGDASSAGAFATEKHDLHKAYLNWQKIRGGFNETQAKTEAAIAAGKDVDPNAAVYKFRNRRGYEGRVFEEPSGRNVMVQAQAPLEGEYRVHIIGGKAVPFSSTRRYVEPFFPTPGSESAAKWMEKQVQKMPQHLQGIPFAADVAPITGGGYKVVELNPSMASGVMGTIPFGGQNLYKHMTGRYTPEMSAVRGLALGGLGAGAVAGGQSIYDRAEGKVAEDEGASKPPERSWLSRYAPLLAGIGAGGLGYGLSRTRFLSSNPVLRGIQESTGSHMYRTPWDLMGSKQYSELPWYSKLKRRLMHGPEIALDRGKRGYKIPKELKDQIRKGKASVFDYGYQEPVEGRFPGWTAEARKLKWGGSRKGLKSPEFEDKLYEMELLKKYAPSAGIRSESLEKILKRHKIKLTGDNTEEALKQLQEAMRKDYPKGFFVKPRAFDASSSGKFPTHKSDFVKLYRDWEKLRPKYLEMDAKVKADQAAGKAVDVNKAVYAVRGRRGYAGRVFDDLRNKNLFVQEKIPIQSHSEAVAKRMKERGDFPGTKEYRVHMIGGEPISGLSTPRYYSGNPFSAVRESLAARRAANWAREQFARMPQKYQGVPMALDIAPLEGGGYKMLEMNPGMASGMTEVTPFGGQNLYKHLTGRYTPEVSAARGLALGGAAAGLTAGGQAIHRNVTGGESRE